MSISSSVQQGKSQHIGLSQCTLLTVIVQDKGNSDFLVFQNVFYEAAMHISKFQMHVEHGTALSCLWLTIYLLKFQEHVW